jgi:hypothetical protein
MFYPFDRPEMAPFFQTDPASGMGDADFLECSLLRAGVKFPDMWRVSTDGKATEIRNYWEDDPDMNGRPGFQPGTWFSPNMPLMDDPIDINRRSCHSRARHHWRLLARPLSCG